MDLLLMGIVAFTLAIAAFAVGENNTRSNHKH